MKRLVACLALALALPALAYADRPATTGSPLFLNVSNRPVVSRTAPRLVENFMEPAFRVYEKSAASLWADSPVDSSQITWGGAGQWVEVSTLAAGQQQVYAQVYFYRIKSATYVLSFTVESKTGTIGGGTSVKVHDNAFSLYGTTTLSDPAVGRHAMVFNSTGSGDAWIRLGIGQDSANAADASIRYSNVMLEIWVPNTTTVAGEYVTPGDTRAFPYTRSVDMTGTLETSVTNGVPYSIPRHTSVLVLGDSFADSKASEPVDVSWGDFPFRMKRRELAGRVLAISTRAVPGDTIAFITTRLASALAETTYTAGVAPWTLCISQGGINDVIEGRTLAQMQADKLAQITAIRAAGMRPVLVGLAPYDAASAGQQAIIDGFNAWLKTLGYPMYDLYADANDGSGNYKTAWASSDGIHPGVTYTGGQSIISQRLMDLIMLVGD